jgi:hypothetical protein
VIIDRSFIDLPSVLPPSLVPKNTLRFIIRATQTQEALGKKDRHHDIRKVTTLVQQRFDSNPLELYEEKVQKWKTRNLSAIGQCKSFVILYYRLLREFAIRTN